MKADCSFAEKFFKRIKIIAKLKYQVQKNLFGKGHVACTPRLIYNTVKCYDGTNTFYFFYNDSKYAPDGFVLNGTDNYLYTKNLQGDITGIADSNGSIVTTYTYDAWGKIISVTGSQSTTIGTANPSATEDTTTTPKQNCIYLKAATTSEWTGF